MATTNEILTTAFSRLEVNLTSQIPFINELFQDRNRCRRLKLLQQYTISNVYDLTDLRNRKFTCEMHFTIDLQKRVFTNTAPSLPEATNKVTTRFRRYIERMETLTTDVFVHGQMDSTESTEQGMINAEGEKHINTILTTSVPSVQSVSDGEDWRKIPHIIHKMSTGEEIVKFPTLLNRYLQIGSFEYKVTDERNSLVQQWSIMRDIYEQLAMPNRLPFQQFVLCRPNIKVIIKTNSHKFAQGRYVLSFLYDVDSIPRKTGQDLLNVHNAVLRDHLFIDLNESNTVELDIPYEAITSWIPCLRNTITGYSGTDYASVYLHCLSPLSVADDVVTAVPATVYIKFNTCEFTGLRYYKDTIQYVDGQMGADLSRDATSAIRNLPVVGGFAGSAMSAASHIALAVQRPFRDASTMQEVEARFKNVGLIKNRDKPAIYDQPMDMRLSTAGNTAVGRYPEPVLPMRLDPAALTVSLPEHMKTCSVSSTKEIMKMWGYLTHFTWSHSDDVKKLLYFNGDFPNVPTGACYTPAEAFSNFYQYYTGSYEYRFDFIGTQFHTGLVMVAWIPYNGAYTYDQARAGYYKVVDIREQKSFTFRVPYISNTVVRMRSVTSEEDSNGLNAVPIGSVRVFVVNPLTPIQSVSTSMDVLVFCRFSDDFDTSFVKMPLNMDTIDYDLPQYGYLNEQIQYVDGQMESDRPLDTGSKETLDQTPEFGLVTPGGALLQMNEDHTNIYDLMRRWIYYADITAKEDKQCLIPILAPSYWKGTVQAAIAKQFRWMRGSIRVMLIAREPNVQTITIFHHPQGSTSRGKPVSVDAAINKNSRAMQVWSPYYTPAIKMEIPFHGQFNFLDLQVGETEAGSYDKIASNLGFLSFKPEIDIKIGIFMCCADDFHFEKFIGNILFKANPTSLTPVSYLTLTNENTVDPYTKLEYVTSDINGTLLNASAKINLPNYLVLGYGLQDTVSPILPQQGINVYNASRGPITFTVNFQSGKGSPVTYSLQPGSVQRITETQLSSIVMEKLTLTKAKTTIITCVDTSMLWHSDDDKSGTIFASFDETFTLPRDVWLQSSGDPGKPIVTSHQITVAVQVYDNEQYYYIREKIVDGHEYSFRKQLSILFQSDYSQQLWLQKTQPTLDRLLEYADGQMDNNDTLINDPLIQDYTGPTQEQIPIASRVWDFPKRAKDCVINTVTSPIRLFRSAEQAVDQVTTTTAQASGTLSYLHTVGSAAEETLEYIKDIARNITDGVKRAFSWIGCTSAVFSSILHFLQAVMNPGWKSFVLAICGVFASMGSFFGDVGQKLLDYFLTISPPTDHHSGAAAADGQSETDPFFTDDQVSSLCSLIFGSVSAFCGYKGEQPQISGMRKMFNFQKTFWLTIYQSGRFLTSIIQVIKKSFNYICNRIEATQVAQILTNENKSTVAFIKEAQKMLDARNASAFVTDPTLKYRFWCCVAAAHQYQARIATKSIPETIQLARLCRDVIELGNKESVQAMACPVRYEPFILALRGESKVGKSFMVQDIMPKILGEIYKVKTYDNPLFCRTPGVEFWNSYRNQPWIVYDDFLASTSPEIAARQVIELYNLKSTAIMNANMANLNEKEMRVNPLGVTLLMNADTVPNGIVSREAFRRRKDAYWVVELDSKYKDIDEVPTHEKLVYGHLKFRLVSNPIHPEQMSDEQYTFNEWYECLKQQMLKYHAKEKDNVRRRLERLRTLLPEHASDMMAEVDPFKIFYAAYVGSAEEVGTQTGLLPSELVEAQLEIIAEARNVLDEEETEEGEQQAEGQADLKEWISSIWQKVMYKDPAPQAFNVKQEAIFMDCPVCYDQETEVYMICENGHGVCNGCSRGLFISGRYNCPTCRGRIRPIEIRPDLFAKSLRILVLARSARTSIEQWSRDAYDFAWAFCTSPTGITLMGYMCYVAMVVNMMRKQQKLIRQQAIEKALVMARFMRDNEFRRAPAFVPNLGIVTDVLVGESFVNGQMDFLNETEPSTSWRSPEVLSVVECPPMKLVVTSSCPHKAVVNYRIENVYYEIDLSTLEPQWVCGHTGSTKSTTTACQYDDCPFKDHDQYEKFLHRWARAHQMEIIMHRNNVNSGRVLTWQLPKCYLPPSAVNFNEQQRSSIVEEYMQIARQRSFLELVGDKIKEFSQWLKVMCYVVAGIASFCGAYKLLGYFRGNSAPQGQLMNSGSFQTRFRPRQPTKIRQGPAQLVRGQMGPQMMNVAVSKVERNTFFIRATAGDIVKTSRGLGVFGRTAIIPKHVGKWLIWYVQDKPNAIWELVSFKNPQLAIPFAVKDLDLKFMDTELAIITIPKTFPMFQDITGFIPTLDQHQFVVEDYSHIECSLDHGAIMIYQGKIKGIRERLGLKKTPFHDEYIVENVYETSYGRDGACGSAYLGGINSPIFALHVAGYSGGGGFGVPLVREDFEELKKGTLVVTTFVPAGLSPPANGQMCLSGKMLPLAAIKKKDVSYLPKTSKIIPSLVHGVIENLMPQTFPGILSPTDIRYVWNMSPLYWGCMKHANPHRPFETGTLRRVYEEYAQRVLHYAKPLRRLERSLTYVQAVVGIPDLEYYDCMALDTSSGWPWNIGTKKTKDAWLQVSRDPITQRAIDAALDTELTRTLDHKESLRKAGIKPHTVFLDWPKDERRKQSKLDLPDGTRIFSLSPIDFTIQLRQMTLDFAASFMKYRFDLEHAIGIAADGPEWTRLTDLLLTNSHLIVTGDYKDFGPRLAPQLVYYSFELMKDWYRLNQGPNEERDRVLSVMCEEVSHSVHLMHDFLYMVVSGAPSGSALTVILNTMGNTMMMRYAYKFLVDEQQFPYDENVRVFTYGDDLIISVKQQIIELFNTMTISDFFKIYDVVFTDASKQLNKKYDDIQNSTFLKRGFKHHPIRPFDWLAPLEEISIHECALWVWKSPSLQEATTLNAHQSVMLAYSHGPEFYDDWKDRVNRALKKIGLPIFTKSWTTLDEQFFGESPIAGSFVRSRLSDFIGLKGNVAATPEASGLVGPGTIVRSRLNELMGLKETLVREESVVVKPEFKSNIREFTKDFKREEEIEEEIMIENEMRVTTTDGTTEFETSQDALAFLDDLIGGRGGSQPLDNGGAQQQQIDWTEVFSNLTGGDEGNQPLDNNRTAQRSNENSTVLTVPDAHGGEEWPSFSVNNDNLRYDQDFMNSIDIVYIDNQLF